MKNSLPYFFFSFFFLTTLSLKGQMESFPCKNSNPELKTLFKSQTIKSLNVHECYGPGLGNLSSSFLMPSGPAPKIIEDPEGGPPNDDAYVNWTCTYTVGKITDNDPKTAWVEGVKGYGTGEVIIVPCLDLTNPVKIWAGYGKSEAVYTTNSRPRKVRVVIIQAQPDSPSQYGTNYANLKVVSEKTTELSDKNGYQVLPVPAFKPESFFSTVFNSKMEYLYLLGLEIVDVYPGTKYDDTCISEIANE